MGNQVGQDGPVGRLVLDTVFTAPMHPGNLGSSSVGDASILFKANGIARTLRVGFNITPQLLHNLLMLLFCQPLVGLQEELAGMFVDRLAAWVGRGRQRKKRLQLSDHFCRIALILVHQGKAVTSIGEGRVYGQSLEEELPGFIVLASFPFENAIAIQ
jgi:hypothetical protein